ncbi:MAG: hypothetical protein RBT01_02345 [Anaerolineaceae bacterium]|jgi:hypothetical protein|nr:hypothetical protein [Anaerolineaceae bacterium]
MSAWNLVNSNSQLGLCVCGDEFVVREMHVVILKIGMGAESPHAVPAIDINFDALMEG